MRIKEFLSKQVVSQVALPSRLVVSGVSIKKTIVGNPTVRTLERMAEALNVPVWHFFIDPEKLHKGNEADDFVAMIRFRGDFYHADTIDELEKLIAVWKEQDTGK